ncbi:uncharacterized protein Triagg1_9323 [Trichoderma aggressivum f. europaeum]|uniref:Uncharacterized protein n=1 Tax=Trichoderma aggressivum f. europaeum TaxID=173218 RepID=A0AAE1I8Q7_9HYPO|nr:hypothetical protein Triagg1_9323 [Trichoderma aggressivum f. europaeum]
MSIKRQYSRDIERGAVKASSIPSYIGASPLPGAGPVRRRIRLSSRCLRLSPAVNSDTVLPLTPDAHGSLRAGACVSEQRILCRASPELRGGMCQIGTQSAKTRPSRFGAMVMLMIHPHLPAWHDTREVQYHPPAPAATTLHVPVPPPGRPKSVRSQVIEVTHPLELFSPSRSPLPQLDLLDDNNQVESCLQASSLSNPDRSDARIQLLRALPGSCPKRHYGGPAEQIRNQGLSCPVPIPFLGGRRSNPPLHFIIPSIVRHCSVIQTASSGSPATRDTSSGALIRPNTRSVLVRTPAGFHSLLVFWTFGPFWSASPSRH